MNRLIIIGNGFDLAHGLKTKYSDFMEYYWNSLSPRYEDDFIQIATEYPYQLNNCKNLNEVIKTLRLDRLRYSDDWGYYSDGPFQNLKFKSEFFHDLSKDHCFKNWVDVEMAYYLKLSDYVRNARTINNMEKLNDDIDLMTRRFGKYLSDKVHPHIISTKNGFIERIFRNDKIEKRDFIQKIKGHIRPNERFETSFILNFNYTSTSDLYFQEGFKSVNIHGRLGNLVDNKILLGFGDEKDSYYSHLENLNQDEYMKHMKSFHYFNNPNYLELFDFIEEADYQVHILGHSCGLSDRTLLQSIFENQNCISIKIHYHLYDMPDSKGNADDYLPKTINISRHFKNKIEMRSKIVNKLFCESLPQNKH